MFGKFGYEFIISYNIFEQHQLSLSVHEICSSKLCHKKCCLVYWSFVSWSKGLTRPRSSSKRARDTSNMFTNENIRIILCHNIQHFGLLFWYVKSIKRHKHKSIKRKMLQFIFDSKIERIRRLLLDNSNNRLDIQT